MAPEPLEPPPVAGIEKLVSVLARHAAMMAVRPENRPRPRCVLVDMKNLPVRLRATILALLVATVVACTPSGGGATSAPAASSATAPSAVPASAAPSTSGRPGY
jgi:hypothetical protein